MENNTENEIEQQLKEELQKLKKAVKYIEEAKKVANHSTKLLEELNQKYTEIQISKNEANSLFVTVKEQLSQASIDSEKAKENSNNIIKISEEFNAKYSELQSFRNELSAFYSSINGQIGQIEKNISELFLLSQKEQSKLGNTIFTELDALKKEIQNTATELKRDKEIISNFFNSARKQAEDAVNEISIFTQKEQAKLKDRILLEIENFKTDINLYKEGVNNDSKKLLEEFNAKYLELRSSKNEFSAFYSSINEQIEKSISELFILSQKEQSKVINDILVETETLRQENQKIATELKKSKETISNLENDFKDKNQYLSIGNYIALALAIIAIIIAVMK